MLAVLDEETVVGGVLTTSKTCSAAVLWCRERLTRGTARALVVNAGNANAFTGKRGDEAVRMTAEAAADAVACGIEDVYLASTGVIGEPMDAGGFAHRLTGMAENAAADQWEEAACAIMTTDTFPKLASTSVTVAGAPVTIAGFAKGSGMIAPDLATMLSFVFTDANIDQAVLQELTAAVADRTFNCTTVDGDTSTSDTVLVFATRQSTAPAITATSSAAAAEFEKALEVVMLDLAPTGRQGRRGIDEVRHDYRHRRREQRGCETDRAVDGQFAVTENGHRRRRCKLGTSRDGRRQSGRGRRSRSIANPVRPL